MSNQQNEKDSSIDDLLVDLPGSMVRIYGEYSGIFLVEVNDEYKAEKEVEVKFRQKEALAIFISFVVVVCLLGIAGYFAPKGRVATVDEQLQAAKLLVAALVVAFIPMLNLVFGYTEKKVKASKVRLKEKSLILNEFRKSVETLNPFNIDYGLEVIHRGIVNLMVKMLNAQDDLSKARQNLAVSTDNLLLYCQAEVEGQTKFYSALDNAEKFGMVFDQSRLHADAKKEMAKIEKV